MGPIGLHLARNALNNIMIKGFIGPSCFVLLSLSDQIHVAI